MPVSDNYKKYGTVDIEYGNVQGTSIKLNYTLGYTTVSNKTTMGGMYAENRGNDEFNVNIDKSYGYCAADKDFGMNKISVITGQRSGTYGGFAINNNKKFDYVAQNQVPIGFMSLADYSSYAYPCFTRSRDAETSYSENTIINSDSVKYPYNYSSTYNECRIYGADINPIIGNLSFKDFIAIPIVRAYGAKNGEDDLATTSPTEIGSKFNSILCDLESYKRYYHTDYPWIASVMIEHYPLYFDNNHNQLHVSASKRILPFISTDFKTNIYISTSEEKEIEYKILFGDDGASASTSLSIHRWNEQTQSVEDKSWTWHGIVMFGIQKFRTAYTKTNAGNANDGFIITTGDLLKCDYTTVGTDHYVKVYSDNLSSDTAVETAYNYIMKQCAYLGCFFKPSAYLENIDYRFIDDNTYMGIIDGSGVTHGEYTRGLENAKNPQYDWKDAVNDTTFKPGGSGPEKPTSDGDKDAEDGYIKGSGTHFTSLSLDDIGLQRYIVTKSDFDNMYEYLNQCLDYPNAYKRFLTNGTAKGISSDVLKQIWSENFPTAAEYTAYIFSKLGYSNDPRANIVSLMLVPFKLTETQTTRRIRLGDGIVGGDFEIYIPTGASTIEEKVVYAPASTFSPAQVKGVEKTVEIIWTGSQNYTIEHPEKWKDFRAYPPYTRAELTIPFHGTIELDPGIAIGKNLSIVLLLDTVTGASIANVRLDGELYASIPGQCGFNVPFSVDASSMTASGLMGLSAQSQVNKLSQQRNSLTGAMTVASSLASGNPAGAIEGIASTLISNKELGIYESAVDFNIQHATDGRIVSNAASALVSFGMPISPRITWHLPLSLGFTNAEYGRTVGFACAKTGKISNFRGYTEFSNADLSTVTATEQEKAMILAQLQNGIII